MAIRPIIEVPAPVLTAVAAKVEEVDDSIRTLLDDMAETMFAAPGIGLAAPQVGVSKRVIVTAVPMREGISEEQESDSESEKAWLTEVINPVIVEGDGAISCEEGCLSVPEMTVEVDRFDRVVIEGLDRHGKPMQFEARGFYAVIFQHEIDHLDGITLLSRLGSLKRGLYLKKLKKLQRDGSGPTAGAS
jgi:peptide deformylase